MTVITILLDDAIMVIKSGSNGLRRYAINGSRVKNAHSHDDDDHHDEDEDEEEEDMSQEGREREELEGHGVDGTGVRCLK